MRKSQILAVPCLLLAANAAWAGEAYVFTMNTSSVVGDAGSIDFALEQGAGADQSLTAFVYHFSSNGTYTAGSQVITGNVTGGPVIPGATATIVANNANQESDDFEGFTYGTTLRFLVDVEGPALNSPDGDATSPYEFVFTTYADPAGTIVSMGSDPLNGAGNITVSPEGAVTTSAVSPDLTIAPAPEPATVWLLAGALGLLGIARSVRRRLIEQA